MAVSALLALSAAAAVRGSRETLDDAVAGKHASVDREVAADHEGAHGGVFLGQDVGLVGQIGLVLAAVDQYEAGVATGVLVAFVGGISPSSTAAEACGEVGNG